MSATSRDLRFGVVVEDTDHWTPEHLAAAEKAGDGYDDWVAAQLEDVMREAGQDFIDNHPDLFRGELI